MFLSRNLAFLTLTTKIGRGKSKLEKSSKQFCQNSNYSLIKLFDLSKKSFFIMMSLTAFFEFGLKKRICYPTK